MEKEEAFERQKERFALTAADSDPRESVAGVDSLAQLVQEGQMVSYGDNNNDATPIGLDKIFLRVNPAGTLEWYAPVAPPAEGGEAGVTGGAAYDEKEPHGKASLMNLTKVVTGPEIVTDATDTFFILIYVEEGGTMLTLDLQFLDQKLRDQWATALRYVIRNMLELGTISRPVADSARGHWLCAELHDRVTALTEEVEQQKSMLDSIGVHRGSRGNMGEREFRRRISEGSDEGAHSPHSPETTADLLAQIAELKKWNKELQEQVDIKEQSRRRESINAGDAIRRTSMDAAKKVRQARKSVVHAGAAVLYAEKMKVRNNNHSPCTHCSVLSSVFVACVVLNTINQFIAIYLRVFTLQVEELEMANNRLQQENLRLEDQIAELESQLHLAKIKVGGDLGGKTGDTGNDHDENVVREVHTLATSFNFLCRSLPLSSFAGSLARCILCGVEYTCWCAVTPCRWSSVCRRPVRVSVKRRTW